MTSISPQNMSTNSWNSLPKSERNKIFLQVQEANNKAKLVIDDHQKTLSELRKKIPEECLEMFEKEKTILLQHYTTAELLPHLPKEGLSNDEAQRMISIIKERVEAQVADQEESKIIKQQIEKQHQENEQLRQKIRDLAGEILRECEEN
ncbi:hypothetical protein GCK72_009899 [Caenorhabditis remanei]|nr:hypothetical protein GCK72_009899 [Caenorhabditis remanei]KAF1761643.1 hypothetical protein GCK72_009899 [Caenorhabditis remanei]